LNGLCKDAKGNFAYAIVLHIHRLKMCT
jgi:hypothetical protein